MVHFSPSDPSSQYIFDHSKDLSEEEEIGSAQHTNLNALGSPTIGPSLEIAPSLKKKKHGINSLGNLRYPEGYTSYEELVHRLQPLDAIFFQGTDFVSRLIRRTELFVDGNGYYSHVGVIVPRSALPGIIPKELGDWFTWESILSGPLTDGVYDVQTNKVFFGVQLRPLKEVLLNQTSPVGIHHLKTPLTEAQLNSLPSLFEKYNYRPYDTNCINLGGQAIPMLRRLRRSLRPGAAKLVCSEFVAALYQDCGLINPQYLPEDVVPINLLGFDQDKLVSPLNTEGIQFFPPQHPAPTLLSRAWNQLMQRNRMTEHRHHSGQ
jgi:hypothetical protein